MCTSITHAINDNGQVRDSASDGVSRTRSKVQTIQNRLKSVLKGMNGEISEQVSAYVPSVLPCLHHAKCPVAQAIQIVRMLSPPV